MSDASQLAVNGGPKAKTTPFQTLPRFGEEELAYLKEALDQQTLFYGFGKQVKAACADIQRYTGMPHIVPCSSGSAAIHLGLIAAGVGPGDEVITTANTDGGTILGIIAEGAVPVFCDCEDTLNPSAATIAAKISDRTRAVVVVHLAGNPAPMPEIMALCDARGLKVVEDCAQSWGARLNGQLVGSFSGIGAYSTNDFKHISTGDGGFVALSDATAYRHVSNYSDKYYDRLFDGTWARAHQGLNYRMSELQGAVARAQLAKVDGITSRQHDLGEMLRAGLADLPGLRLLQLLPGAYSSYWWTAAELLPEQTTVSREDWLKALQAEGVQVSSYGRYDLIATKLFQERVVRPWVPDARKHYPLTQPDGRVYTYDHRTLPNHRRWLDRGIMISTNGRWSDQDMAETIAGFRKVALVYGSR